MRDIDNFESIMINLASSDKIRQWSYGEVKKPETINYRTLRPERDGLFCERIFGTTKEWECYCGKFKSIRYKGVVCDRCGVEVTHFKVRRERMGHIELAAPIAHIWYYRATPSRIGLLLDISNADLQSVLYYERYIVLDAGDTELKRMALLTEEDYSEAVSRYGDTFTADMGASAIATLLQNLDLDMLNAELRALMVEKGAKSDKRLLKRIEIIEKFRTSQNKPDWMIMNVIPVIPPELRPMVQLDGGRFATSDLNDLYRRIINRNNRLKRLIVLSAPDIIIRNEKRMLQDAVDALFDNSKKKRAVRGSGNRMLKSLSDMLKGKQGRFRQNLLGKRVDYSGRSVIVVGPDLKLHQCGLPIKMALELYKPFIMRKLVANDVVYNIKKAKIMVEEQRSEVLMILDDVVKEHPVLLNRAPTLHRLGIQAFEPVLVEGKAIRLHPLVCPAFNADFDGDQMAVHVPLTQAAQIECWTLMLSARNLLNPANGRPIVFPSLDMVIGIYYLTKERDGDKGEGKRFYSINEVIYAIENHDITYHAKIQLLHEGAWLSTTGGRCIFNADMPKEIAFQNLLFDDKALRVFIADIYASKGAYLTVQVLDLIKDLGFKYATLFGVTISISDIIIPDNKEDLLNEARAKVSTVQNQYYQGHITNDERYNRVVEVWTNTSEHVAQTMMNTLSENNQGFNPVYMMADSGARGSKNQLRQLAGMRGLMAKPSGDIIELPILSNFKEGLSVIEFFISTNGARKGLADTALKTADAGYLTRRLVDIAQDVVINEYDCGTINGVEVSALKDGEDIVESLGERIIGCFTIERIKHPISGEMLLNVNEEITEEIATVIENIGIEMVKIRSVLTCESRQGVCQKCYGRNLTTGKVVDVGEAVGVIAAQSIGQPGTQLTMRTFHIGGVATRIAEENRVYVKYGVIIEQIIGNVVSLENNQRLFTRNGFIIVRKIIDTLKFENSYTLLVNENDKVVKNQHIIDDEHNSFYAKDNAIVLVKDNVIYLVAQEQKLPIRNGSELFVEVGDILQPEEIIAMFDPFSEHILSEYDGIIQYIDIDKNTLREEISSETGNVERKIADIILESLQPRIVIIDKETKKELGNYYLPSGAYISVDNEQEVKAGHTLAKILKESAKTGDITGGLPRVGELFESRIPKNVAVLAAVSGRVHFKGITKSKRIIIITDIWGNEHKHQVLMHQHLLVREGDDVEVGSPLCDGPKNPHDILQILGAGALQNYLLNEIQEVYRLQGVDINDKHISVIIRQMMRKVEVVYVGDTRFIFEEKVDKYEFQEENKRVIREGGNPAIACPLLIGITQASLNINSFISAASFQETTKVLTNAAIASAVDNLHGLKENIIIGNMIPAGTGMKNYRKMKLYDDKNEDVDEYIEKIVEQRKLERELEVERQQKELRRSVGINEEEG